MHQERISEAPARRVAKTRELTAAEVAMRQRIETACASERCFHCCHAPCTCPEDKGLKAHRAAMAAVAAALPMSKTARRRPAREPRS